MSYPRSIQWYHCQADLLQARLHLLNLADIHKRIPFMTGL
jgi:hypothetical protein